jgi:hypothetical protein
MPMQGFRLAGAMAGVLALVALTSAAAQGMRPTVGAAAARTAERVADQAASGPPVLRIVDVRLNPGGFQPCPDSELAVGMPFGHFNPDAQYLKCVTAQVTVAAVQGTENDYPTLAAGLEAWGFAVIDARRYDYRSPPQLYQQTYRFGATGPQGQSRWTWPTAVVTYYDGKLEWANPGPPGGSLAGSNVPAVIRDHVSSAGALVVLTIAGADAPSVRCRYFGPNGASGDRLVCSGLPTDRLRSPINGEDRGPR